MIKRAAVRIGKVVGGVRRGVARPFRALRKVDPAKIEYARSLMSGKSESMGEEILKISVNARRAILRTPRMRAQAEAILESVSSIEELDAIANDITVPRPIRECAETWKRKFGELKKEFVGGRDLLVQNYEPMFVWEAAAARAVELTIDYLGYSSNPSNRYLAGLKSVKLPLPNIPSRDEGHVNTIIMRQRRDNVLKGLSPIFGKTKMGKWRAGRFLTAYFNTYRSLIHAYYATQREQRQ